MKLILLTYENRSGSTFLTKQLSSNQILCCPESDFLTSLLEGVIDFDLKFLLGDIKQLEWGIDIENYEALYNNDLDKLSIFSKILFLYHKTQNSDSNFILFKTTQVPFIKKEILENLFNYFDDIFIIHVNRNPLNIYNSQKVVLQSKTKKPMEYSALKFVLRVFERQQKLKKIKFKKFKISFEDLILHTEEELKRVLLFLNIKKLDSVNYNVGTSQAYLHDRKKIDFKQAKRNIDNLSLIEIIFIKKIFKTKSYLLKALILLIFIVPILINDFYNFINQKINK